MLASNGPLITGEDCFSKMKAYVGRNGQNLGLFSIEQIRGEIEAGRLHEQDLACHDGANWIRLKDLPGLFQQPAAKVDRPVGDKEKPKIIWFILPVFACCIVAVWGISALFFGKENEQDSSKQVLSSETLEWNPDQGESDQGSSKPTFSSGTLELTPDQVVKVYDGDTFFVHLPGIHEIFGNNISIRIKGIDTPEMRGTSDEIKVLATKARELTERTLKEGKRIQLRNPERGKYFRIVAEVWVDGNALADILKAEELAQDYDGEGERPTW